MTKKIVNSNNEKSPCNIHKDDDNVFAATLRAILKIGNKPTSPKKLACMITKYKHNNSSNKSDLIENVHHILSELSSLSSEENVTDEQPCSFSDYQDEQDIVAAIAITKLSQNSRLTNHHQEIWSDSSEHFMDIDLLNTLFSKNNATQSNAKQLDETHFNSSFAYDDLALIGKDQGDSTRRSSWPVDCRESSSVIIDPDLKNEKKREHFELVCSVFKGHPFKIIKRWLGDLGCLELESPDDIVNTKILRVISTIFYNHSNTNDSIAHLKPGYINATQLRKAAIPVLGEGIFDVERERKQNSHAVVITNGPKEVKGVWVSLQRARELVEEFEIESSPGLSKFLSDDPLDENDTLQVLKDKPCQNTNDKDVCLPFMLKKEDVSMDEGSSSSQSNKISTNDIQPKRIRSVVEAPKFRKHAKIAPSPNPSNTPEILKSLNVHNINLSSLASNTSNTQLAKNLTLFMQYYNILKSVTSANTEQSMNNSTTPSISSTLSSSTSTYSSTDIIKTILSSQSNHEEYQHQSKPIYSTEDLVGNTRHVAASTSENDAPIIYPKTPTEPTMHITMLDNIAVCIASIRRSPDDTENCITRRLDNNFINGTQLLTAGGIETESERSMILSFEMKRVRIPHKKSPLFGTWIPLRRALELAATCSIQHILGPFLEDDIQSLFPSPLPTTNRKRRASRKSIQSDSLLPSHHLAALTLAALKNSNEEEGSTKETQILTHPNKTLKTAQYTLKAPLFGEFEEFNIDKQYIIIDKPMCTLVDELIPKEQDYINDKMLVDEDEDTETDYDIEEVREDMRKIRDAAIAAMEIGNTIELNGIFEETKLPPKQQKKLYYNNDNNSRKHYRRRKRHHQHHHHHKKQGYHKEKKQPLDNNQDNCDEEEDGFEDSDKEDHSFVNINPTDRGGKWSSKKQTTTIATATATATATAAPTMIKKHKVSKSSNTSKTKPTKKELVENFHVMHTVVNEEDEDEDVDIGGSDHDDDLR